MPADGRIAWTDRVHQLLRQWEKPSTEVQGDALGVLSISLVSGVIGTAALVAAGLGAGFGVAFASLTGVVAAASSWISLRKLRFEHPYGTFFSTSVAIASDDVTDASGTTLIRAGVTEICEFHVVRNLERMGELTSQGLVGRLAVILECLEGIREFANDIDSDAYRDVSYIVARSDLTGLLVRFGFTVIPNPPPYDLINRVQKHVLNWRINLTAGQPREGNPATYPLTVITRERFVALETRAALDTLIERTRISMEKAKLRPTGS